MCRNNDLRKCMEELLEALRSDSDENSNSMLDQNYEMALQLCHDLLDANDNCEVEKFENILKRLRRAYADWIPWTERSCLCLEKLIRITTV